MAAQQSHDPAVRPGPPAASPTTDIRSRPSSASGRLAVAASVAATIVALVRISTLVSAAPGVPHGDDGTVADAAVRKANETGAGAFERAELVVWFGWITAACTGLGVVPFLFTSRLPKAAAAVSNAVACGMMLAATLGLVLEGIHAPEPGTPQVISACAGGVGAECGRGGGWAEAHWGAARTALGVAIGMAFVKVTEALMHGDHGHGHGHGHGAAALAEAGVPSEGPRDAAGREVAVAADAGVDEDRAHEILEAQAALSGADWRRALLFFVVMAAHSLAEGIGLGVSFGGARGARLGSVISTTLAVHNVPEGLAICLVMVPQGVSLVDAAAMAVVSSLPQPIFALPAFFFVDTFAALLPAGLGFAGGAMMLVAAEELWPQATRALGTVRAATAVCLAFALMMVVQQVVHES